MSILVLLGRVLFSSLFIMGSLGHFTKPTVDYAASAGVPFAHILVPLSGILILLGGLSVLLGYKARLGAWLIIIFLIPVTLTMHKFWGLADPGNAQLQQIMFMKNLSLLGAALLITYFGSGPLSIDRE